MLRIISHYHRHRHMTFLGSEKHRAKFLCGCGAYMTMWSFKK